jgi:hypothetical protein
MTSVTFERQMDHSKQCVPEMLNLIICKLVNLLTSIRKSCVVGAHVPTVQPLDNFQQRSDHAFHEMPSLGCFMSSLAVGRRED